ncbi:MAG: hypothetical protein K6A68_13330 [Clostridiales bacterium]|nr:hypothetical protein [Clostridia bacterium]MCR4884552.1 hypothetical protein [Clostridiales bacterium]
MKNERSYHDATHFYGRIWTASAILMFLMVPLAISLHYNAWAPIHGVVKGLLGVAPVFWTVGVIEVLTYAPMLGTGGTYLAFVTGSLSSLKVPCVLNALKGANVEPGTEEAEALSTIAVATSSLVTTLVIALGVFGIRFLQPVLENPVLKPAFDNIMPALMGSLALVYFSRNWKLSVAPLVFMVALFIAVPSLSSSVGIFVPVAALVALLAGRILQKKGLID